jgi:hypothetical protein
MSTTARAPTTIEIISPRGYTWLLGDPWLRRAVIPGGLLTSPYEILDYRSILMLHDPEGMRATFMREQAVRFLHDGVTAILDHAYGHGVLASDYEHSAGRLDGSYKDEAWRHFVIALRHKMRRGDVLQFRVRRQAKAGFLKSEGWLETTLDHRIASLRPSIVFPKDRPCRRAALEVAGRRLRLPIVRRKDAGTVVHVTIPHPLPFVRYTIRWRW